jgi:hypothetical protein
MVWKPREPIILYHCCSVSHPCPLSVLCHSGCKHERDNQISAIEIQSLSLSNIVNAWRPVLCLPTALAVGNCALILLHKLCLEELQTVDDNYVNM